MLKILFDLAAELNEEAILVSREGIVMDKILSTGSYWDMFIFIGGFTGFFEEKKGSKQKGSGEISKG